MSSEEVKKEEVPAETGGTVDDSDKPAAEGEPLVKILDKEQLKTNEESEETLYKEYVLPSTLPLVVVLFLLVNVGLLIFSQ
tara:strand:+ start:248 stop:490 length:243 start_codon:yes stop_codon:yes gene_type:complete